MDQIRTLWDLSIYLTPIAFPTIYLNPLLPSTRPRFNPIIDPSIYPIGMYSTLPSSIILIYLENAKSKASLSKKYSFSYDVLKVKVK